jgi:hypothetical protein
LDLDGELDLDFELEFEAEEFNLFLNTDRLLYFDITARGSYPLSVYGYTEVLLINFLRTFLLKLILPLSIGVESVVESF